VFFLRLFILIRRAVLEKHNSGSEDDLQENSLIKAAYAATLNPEKLADFERFWEAYIDAQLQKNPHGFDFNKTPVNGHILIALDILERVRHVGEEQELVQSLVDSHYGFGFIIDEAGKIISSNSDAEGFTYGKTRLADLAVDNVSINDITSWMNQNPDYHKNSSKFFHVYLHGREEPKTWFLSSIRLNSKKPTNKQKYFLVTSVGSDINEKDADKIGNSFKLTAAETEVATLLSNGFTPKGVAQQRKVKISAVRAQIKSIKYKMSAKDIPEIVRIFTSMAIRSSAVTKQIGRMEHITGISRARIQKHAITLRDGRSFQYFVQGHPNGRVILQIHSLISGVEFPGVMNRKLVHHGYQMISPSRAGYGKSESNIKLSLNDLVDSCVDDLIEVLDHIQATDVVILTGWAGCIAQRLALKDSERFKGLVLSGAVPVWQPEYLEYLSPRYRNIIKTSIHAPKAVPYLVRVIKALIDSGKTNLLIDSLDTQNMTDWLALQNKVLYNSVLTRFKHLVEQDIWAFTHDLPTVHHDWSDDARKLKLPVTVVMGEDNTDQPKEAIDRYLASVPQAKLVIIPKAGSYQNLSHFEEVLDAINNL